MILGQMIKYLPIVKKQVMQQKCESELKKIIELVKPKNLDQQQQQDNPVELCVY